MNDDDTNQVENADPPTETKPDISDMAAISVSARLPEFWKEQPRIWFLQVEAVLFPQKLSDDAKYHLIVAKLERDVILQISDILSKPPAENKYKTLKNRLLNIYEESESEKIRKLIEEMDLGTQKPSQLLRKMRDLAKDRIQDSTLAVLWQGHLPSTVKAVLAVTDKTDLDVLATIADKVTEAAVPMKNISSVDQPASSSTSMIATIKKLRARIANLENTRGRSRQRSRSGRDNSNSKTRSQSRDSKSMKKSNKNPDWLCFYHYRYKEKAAKCIKPCNWKSQGN